MPDHHEYPPSEIDLSVVVPVYNSAATLVRLFAETKAACESLDLKFELLLIDDSSADHSWETIQELKAKHGERIKGFQLTKNSGQQAATFCGLQHATGRWIVTIDDDLQTPPAEISSLWAAAQDREIDIVYGRPTRINQRFLYRLGRKVFRFMLRKMALNFPDGTSFRLIKGTLVGHLPEALWPWSHIDPILGWQTTGIAVVDVRHEKRQVGKSGYSFIALINMSLHILLIYSTLPLLLMIWAGFIAALFSIGLGTYFIFQKLLIGAQLGFTALIVTITFAASIILICLGVLGIYISKIYGMTSGQPAYVIKSKI